MKSEIAKETFRRMVSTIVAAVNEHDEFGTFTATVEDNRIKVEREDGFGFEFHEPGWKKTGYATVTTMWPWFRDELGGLRPFTEGRLPEIHFNPERPAETIAERDIIIRYLPQATTLWTHVKGLADRATKAYMQLRKQKNELADIFRVKAPGHGNRISFDLPGKQYGTVEPTYRGLVHLDIRVEWDQAVRLCRLLDIERRGMNG